LTFFIVFTVFALGHLVGGKGTYLDCLTTLLTDYYHGTGIVEVQISIILVFKFFIKTLTKVTDVLWVDYIFRMGDLDKLILQLLKLLSFICYWNLLYFIFRKLLLIRMLRGLGKLLLDGFY
jgi:hypothetical protein